MAKIARGVILGDQMAKNVIDNRGSNTFLQEKEFHSGVREYFQDTPTGVRKKINIV